MRIECKLLGLINIWEKIKGFLESKVKDRIIRKGCFVYKSNLKSKSCLWNDNFSLTIMFLAVLFFL